MACTGWSKGRAGPGTPSQPLLPGLKRHTPCLPVLRQNAKRLGLWLPHPSFLGHPGCQATLGARGLLIVGLRLREEPDTSAHHLIEWDSAGDEQGAGLGSQQGCLPSASITRQMGLWGWPMGILGQNFRRALPQGQGAWHFEDLSPAFKPPAPSSSSELESQEIVGGESCGGG